MNSLYLLHRCVMRCFKSGKIKLIWWTHHTRFGLQSEEHVKNTTNTSPSATRHCSNATWRRAVRYGTEVARTRNVTTEHRQRNGTTGYRRLPRHDSGRTANSSLPVTTCADSPPPIKAPTTATPLHIQLGYHTLTIHHYHLLRLRVWYLPWGPVIIVRKPPKPTPPTEICRPRGCYRVRSKNII